MNRLLQTLVTIAWGLWFGGLVMLFITLQTVFSTFKDERRPIAGETGSSLFHVFNYYHLALAAAALLLTVLWRLTGSARFKTVVFTCFALATLAVVFGTAVLTRKIEILRLAHLTQTPEFKRLHGISMMVYLAETVFVFFAGLFSVWADDKRALSLTEISPPRP